MKLIKADSDHFVGAIREDQAAQLLQEIAEVEFSPATFINGKQDSRGRSSDTGWIHEDRVSVLGRIMEVANKNIWKKDLKYHSFVDQEVQVTKYSGAGAHYRWHRDTHTSSYAICDYEARQLSISLCLSHTEDYEGGEFDLRRPRQKEIIDLQYKLGFGEFIVFDSHSLHRVNPLVSGERITLVGWYH